jgi:TonB family protein
MRSFPKKPTAQPSAVQPMSQSTSSWPEIENLADKMVPEIKKYKIKTLFVIGSGDPGAAVTDLTVQLRDALSDSLAHHSQDVSVIGGMALRAFLKQNRISERMLYSTALADWITIYIHADAFVSIRIEGIWDRRIRLAAELHPKKKDFESVKGYKYDLGLSDLQIQASTWPHLQSLKIPDEKEAKSGMTDIGCIYCPHPDYTDEARNKKVTAKLIVWITVRPDGTADDILIRNPVGFGLDAEAIEKILGWKFKPATKEGHPVAAQTQVEIYWELR